MMKKGTLMVLVLFVSLGLYGLTLGIMPVETVGITGDDKDVFMYGFPDAISHYFSKDTTITVVERARLAKVLQEAKLGMLGVIDESTAPKVGELLGAEYVVIGTVYYAEDGYRIFLKVVNTSTGEVKGTIKKMMKDKGDVFIVGKEIAKDIAKVLGLEVSLGEELEGLSYEAFVHYSKGLGYSFQGREEDAKRELRKAKKEAPNFSWDAFVIEGIESSFDELEALEDDEESEDEE